MCTTGVPGVPPAAALRVRRQCRTRPRQLPRGTPRSVSQIKPKDTQNFLANFYTHDDIAKRLNLLIRARSLDNNAARLLIKIPLIFIFRCINVVQVYAIGKHSAVLHGGTWRVSAAFLRRCRGGPSLVRPASSPQDLLTFL